MKRRDFFSALTGLSVGLPIVLAETPTNGTRLRVAQPFQGAVLHPRLKDAVIDGKIKVSGEAPPDAAVTVNGIACRRKGNAFEAEIELRQKVNEIVVKSQSPSGEVQEAAVTVLWLKNSVPRYRFTIDDTLFFLREIHRSGYKSLFEDEFLGNLRRLHRKYGMKVALNLFYETSGDKEYLTVEREHFDLSQFSDKYKSQWRDNTDWLRLAFHAKREHPGEPYKNASAETLIG
ncbi:MAG: hypothetical protein FWC43_11845, partial [Planctomycetaceae bacterium]|nr:hypothetical protein [Planctomycetaceae bacterium]